MANDYYNDLEKMWVCLAKFKAHEELVGVRIIEVGALTADEAEVEAYSQADEYYDEYASVAEDVGVEVEVMGIRGKDWQ